MGFLSKFEERKKWKRKAEVAFSESASVYVCYNDFISSLFFVVCDFFEVIVLVFLCKFWWYSDYCQLFSWFPKTGDLTFTYFVVRFAYFSSISFAVRRSKRQFHMKFSGEKNRVGIQATSICASVCAQRRHDGYKIILLIFCLVPFSCMYHASRRAPFEVTAKRIKIFVVYTTVSFLSHFGITPSCYRKLTVEKKNR